MTTRILLFALVIAGFSSCTTYRSGQTPDDVYYSPAREVDAYVQTEKDEDRTSYNENRLEDQRLRQQIRDQRFRNFDDDIYWNSPRYNNNNWNYGLGYNHGISNWNTWGYNTYTWGSPFICVPGSNIIILGPGAPKNSTGIRYSPQIQSFTGAGNTNSGNTGKGNYNGGNGGSRYFGGASNNTNRTPRSSFFNEFFGGGTNSSSGGSSGNRTYSGGNNNGSSNGGSRTFSSGGSSSSGSSNSGGGSKPASSGRRN
jgi:hypothetical protein